MTASLAPAPYDPASEIPEGFSPMDRGGPFLQAMGPLYWKRTPEGGAIVALQVAHKHTNLRGVTHGGMLATMADGALGVNISLARGKRGDQATVTLTVDYLSGARVGDWLEAHVYVRRTGKRLAFADCLLKVGDKEVLRGSAVFAIGMEPAPGVRQQDMSDD